jgi:hypothetical protein
MIQLAKALFTHNGIFKVAYKQSYQDSPPPPKTLQVDVNWQQCLQSQSAILHWLPMYKLHALPTDVMGAYNTKAKPVSPNNVIFNIVVNEFYTSIIYL